MTVWVADPAVKTISADGVVCASTAPRFDAPVTSRPTPATSAPGERPDGEVRPGCVQSPQKQGSEGTVRLASEARRSPQ